MKLFTTFILLLSVTLCLAGINPQMGPSPIINESDFFVGRISSLVTSPTDENKYFAGSADGGVWRTTDGGNNWLPITDNMPTTAIGSLAMDPNNEDIIYAGTGESNYANHSRYGLGIYKSIDSGDSWTVIGADIFSGRSVSKIIVSHDNSDIIYASVSPAGGFPALAAAKQHPDANGLLGVFKSTDAGESWQHLSQLPALPVSSFVINGSNNQILYAAVGDIYGHVDNGLYKSIDGGSSWNRLSVGLLNNSGAHKGRTTVAISPVDSTKLYYSVVNRAFISGGGASLNMVYASSDSGNSWHELGRQVFMSSFGWYFSVLEVLASDADNLYLGGLSATRSINGAVSQSSENWSDITPPHVDIHGITEDADSRLLIATDGGVYRSENFGLDWQALNNGLSNVQFYAGVSINFDDKNTIIAGAQDNGTLRSKNLSIEYGHLFGGDGGWTQIDKTNNDLFMEFQGTSNMYRLRGTQYTKIDPNDQITGRTAFFAPYLLDPRNSNRMIYATERIFESNDAGQNWHTISPDLSDGFGAVRSMAMAPSNPDFVYVATNDGNVMRSQDGGHNFTQIADNIPGWPRVTREIFVHPTDENIVYLAVAAFDTQQIRYSSNGGSNWTALDGDLPNTPVNTILVKPQQNMLHGIIYAGTDIGLYISIDDGQSWQKYGKGLPNVPVIDIRLDDSGSQLVVVTQGRGIWIFQEFSTAGNKLFQPDEMTNAWVTQGVQRQGILSSILASVNNEGETQITDFSAIFTYDTKGVPIWMVMQTIVPSNEDSYQLPIFYPTGDLSIGGTPNSIIGIATKSRLSDESQQIITRQLNYQFDFTDNIKKQLAETYPNSYDEEFFNNNPMHGILHEATFNSILPDKQRLKTFCSPHGKVLVSNDNVAEGRLQYTFENNGQLNVFGANFTYLRGDIGNDTIGPILDGSGKATPTWEVYDNFSNDLTGIDQQGGSNHQVYLPTQGTGFFVVSSETIDIEQIEIEQNHLETIGNSVNVIVNRRDGSVQSHKPVAQSSLCYGFSDLPR